MADPTTTDAPEGAIEPAEAEDPLAADRRTLVIGGTAMVVLILIGVISAQLFARGGCTAVVSPEPAAAVATDTAPEDVVAGLGLDGARAVDIVEQAAGSPVVAAIPVGEATRLARLGDGLVAAGPRVTSLDASLSPEATFTTDDQVVGDGPTVFDVTVPNTLTGQTDAFVPLTGTGFDVGACRDTAVVGSPFAFHLDAGDGQLLLLRADEDGDRPHLQLRDAEAITVWDAHLTLPEGPPGTLAERLDAELGPEMIVAARRVGPQEETPSPALVAVSRDDGELRFELGSDDLAAAADLDPADPIRWEVAAVGHDTALVHGRPDPQDGPEATPDEAPDDGRLVLLDLADGTVTPVAAGLGPLTGAAAAAPSGPDTTTADRYVVATADGGNGSDSLAFVDADGEVISLGSPIAEPRFAWAEGAVLVAARDSLSRLTPDTDIPSFSVLPGGRFADVVVTDDARVATLVTPRDGGDAVLLVTDPATDGSTVR